MSAATYVVSISAGLGPIEARCFVRQLGARIERLCAEAGLVVLEAVEHEADGEPRSVDLQVVGDANAALAREIGTHALLARSKHRGRSARRRWFASVDVSRAPEALDVAREIDPRELEITATTAGGPGGQHVNKVSSAVRVRHLPSGLVVRVADERSQRSNLRRAIARIAALLQARSDRASRVAIAALRDRKIHVARGGAVRVYWLGRQGELEIAGELRSDEDEGKEDACAPTCSR
jgi:protein subunit release factor B